jgi:CRP-like cAMP-binding protein
MEDFMSRVDGSHPALPGTSDTGEWTGITHPFLDGMEPRRARQLLYSSEVVHYEAGEILFREGQPADRFFLVESGLIALEASVNGHSVQIDQVGGGEVFGWSWLFPPFAWHFQARVLAPTLLIVCDGSRLLVRCEEDADFGYDVMKRIAQVLIHRLQATRKRLVGIETVLNPPEASPHVH